MPTPLCEKGVLSAAKEQNEQYTEMESGLRGGVQLRGTISHRSRRDVMGVLERVEKVDMGDGLGEREVIVIDWTPNDPGNPFNWSEPRKYIIVWVAVLTTMLTAMNCTSVAILTAAGGPEHFGVNRESFVLTLTLLLLTISFTPLILAPLSETVGRNMILQITSVITALLFLPQALSKNFSLMLAVRFFQGMSSSVGNSMVPGTIADLFHAKDRGSAMNLFALMIFAGQSLGGALFGYIAMDWGIAWAYGVSACILGAFSCVLNLIVLRETRSDVLLSRRARRLTKESGKLHLCAADISRQSFWTVMSISLVRPLQYLVTEPIVSALSAWIAFAWACVFLGGTSILLVFQEYGWNYGQLGMIQITVLIGGILGAISNRHQEYLFRRSALKPGNNGRSPPEARLYWAAYGGLMFPLAMFVFAWTGRPWIPWAVPAVCLIIANWGIYSMYVGIFNYIADAYEVYSSSAQAAQSFCRNMASATFPLFAHQMYKGLGYPQATTLVASVALALAAAPLLLLRYGKVLRARSRVASALEGSAEIAEETGH
ncbi:MSF transporter [Dioszegia hungarica]|uniref:MSF transporter n=1 Tax=Dioszegia hungarica TaxID=4972 RepID=A0AA38H8Q1_9TREE|nr:MSF transporter [Dioszegia hungarica]KAI9636527.1 MSF transporter [Dioszegia hungarica]